MTSTVDWGRLRERLAATDGLRPLGLGEVFIGAGALGNLQGTVAALAAGRPGAVVVLRDPVTKRIGPDELHAVVRATLGDDVRELVLTGSRGVVHADESTVDTAVAGTGGASVIVTVGSGTLADLGKVAAATNDVPHVIVQTAASVNGFSDDQSVLLRSGVKRTVASRWPDALIVDADILAGAPPEHNRAGVGDLLSMFTAPADWLLADAIGLPVNYHQVPVDLVRPHGELLLSLAPKLAAADPGALAVLAELLTLSGISMGVAGGTAVSSGHEHLISHLLDMHCAANDLEPDAHGAQVGVGSLVATSTWTRVRAALRAGTVGHLELPDPDQARRRIEDAFGRLDPTGATAAECWNAYATKLRRLDELRPRLQLLLATWSELDTRLDAVLVEPAVLATALDTLGAPVGFGDLRPRYSPEVARWAITNAHLMRDRFTIADLSDLLGLGGPQGTDAVLADLDALGAGR